MTARQLTADEDKQKERSRTALFSLFDPRNG
jgi:hypothetical protein